MLKGAGSECTPVEEIKPERALSEDRERGTSEEKDPSLELWASVYWAYLG